MRFRLIVLSIFSLLFAYLFHRLVLPFEGLTALLLGFSLAGMFAVVLWVPLVFWQLDVEETTWRQRAALGFAFVSMGVLSFALVLSFLREVAGLLNADPFERWRSSAAILFGSVVLCLVGTFIAHFRVAIKHVRVPIEEIPAVLSGLKILQITDLHVGPTIRRRFVEKVVAKANAEKPDLIVLTGDAVDGTVKDLLSEVEPLARLEAPLGKYYVLGNHECYWDAPGWSEKMRSLGFIPLANASQVVESRGARLAIAGVPDPAISMTGLEGPDFAKAASAIPADVRLRIVLCHQPKFAVEAEKAGFSIQLSGHTHGGQFIPWTLVAALVHRFNYGLHRMGRLWIYVSRGTGYWGPPVRIGSPAEITLLTLERP